MNALNSVQLFILVWTFTAVCRADEDISVRCEDVTGVVGEEATFTCSVSQKCSERCITLYKFYYTDIYNDSTICRQDLPEGSCDQRNSFTCRYAPTTVVPGQFRFFVQTKCGWKDREFTVNITEQKQGGGPGSRKGDNTGSEESPGSNDTVVPAVAGCFIIIIIIIMIITYKMKPNYSKPCGLQKRMLLGRGNNDDDNNSNCPGNMT